MKASDNGHTDIEAMLTTHSRIYANLHDMVRSYDFYLLQLTAVSWFGFMQTLFLLHSLNLLLTRILRHRLWAKDF